MSHTHQEEDTDPFLELEPQTLYHHEHEHRPHAHSHSHSNPHSHSHSHNTRGQVNEDHIDPSLHEGNNTGRTNTNRLTDFASHILGSQDGDQHDHDHDHDHADVQGRHELSFTGEGGVLESSNHGFHVMDHDHRHEEEEEEVDEGEFEPHLEEEGEGEGEGEGEFIGEAQTPGPHSLDPVVNGQVAARVGRKRGAYGKRKRAGAGVDEVVIKKMNHASPSSLVVPVSDKNMDKADWQKEVERKRRNNISDGIDQLVSQMAIPELEKAGKSVQLRKASEYMAELGERVGVLEKEVGDLRGEKLDLEANLALTSQRYTEEHERCTRYETLWRDAQDREAKGQFEIAQLLDEISQLRAKR